MEKLIQILTIAYQLLLLCGCNNPLMYNKEQIYSLQYTNDSILKNYTDYKLLRTTHIEKDLNYVCERHIKNGASSEKCDYYKYFNNAVYAIKIIYDFDGTPLDTVLLLNYFTKKDTSFHYFYDFQKYPPTNPFGIDDYFYSIAKIGKNLYVLYKENFIDSTFSELHFFNDDFYIIKIIKITKNKFYEFIGEKYKDNPRMKSSFMKDYYERIKRKNVIYKYTTIK